MCHYVTRGGRSLSPFHSPSILVRGRQRGESSFLLICSTGLARLTKGKKENEVAFSFLFGVSAWCNSRRGTEEGKEAEKKRMSKGGRRRGPKLKPCRNSLVGSLFQLHFFFLSLSVCSVGKRKHLLLPCTLFFVPHF